MDSVRCLLCHRTLKDAESQARRLGPTCWHKLKRLDKQEKAKQKEKHEAKKLKDKLLKGQINMFEEKE